MTKKKALSLVEPHLDRVAEIVEMVQAKKAPANYLTTLDESMTYNIEQYELLKQQEKDLNAVIKANQDSLTECKRVMTEFEIAIQGAVKLTGHAEVFTSNYILRGEAPMTTKFDSAEFKKEHKKSMLNGMLIALSLVQIRYMKFTLSLLRSMSIKKQGRFKH